MQSSELGFLDWRYGEKQSSTESKVFLNVVPWEILENRVACKPGCIDYGPNITDQPRIFSAASI